MSFSINKWQRLILLVGSIGFFAHGVTIYLDEYSERSPTIPFSFFIVFAFLASGSKGEGEEALPFQGWVLARRKLMFALIGAMIALSLALKLGLFAERRVAEEAQSDNVEMPAEEAISESVSAPSEEAIPLPANRIRESRTNSQAAGGSGRPQSMVPEEAAADNVEMSAEEAVSDKVSMPAESPDF